MAQLDTPCVVFQGYKTPTGYGRVRVKVGGKWETHGAHRKAYADKHGPIPKGMQIRHKCDNPPCINPEHLELGTQLENMQDRTRRERHPIKKLSDADVVDIKRAFTEPYRGIGRDLAAKYGVKESTISQIRNSRRRTDG